METKKIISDYEYLTITGWMVNRYKLKGNELIAFAYIYQITQGTQENYMDISHLCCFLTNKSEDYAMQILEHLSDKRLIHYRIDDGKIIVDTFLQ